MDGNRVRALLQKFLAEIIWQEGRAEEFLVGRHFQPGECPVEQFAGGRSRHRAAEMFAVERYRRLVHRDYHENLRLVHRRSADKRTDMQLARILSGTWVELLGGPRFAENLIAADSRLSPRPAADHGRERLAP